MGEMTSKTKAALAAIIAIARLAAETGRTDVFRGYVEQTGYVEVRGGGWLYVRGYNVHGMKSLAAHIAGGDFAHLAALMAEQYAKTMPDEPTTAARPTPGPERTTHVGTLGLRSCADEGCDGCTPEQHAAEHAAARRFSPDEHVLTPNGLAGIVTQTYNDGELIEVSVGDNRATYPPEYLRLRRLTAPDGRRFEIGDVVCWRREPGEPRWRVRSLYDPAGREPYAGLVAIDDTELGELMTAGKLRLLVHASQADNDDEQVPIGEPREHERNIAAIKTLAEQLDVSLDELGGMTSDPATTDRVDELVDRIVRRAQYAALSAMLPMLDGWIEGARENHEAFDRRDAFDTSFEPDDIRCMVNDVARELGVPEPWRKAAS